jgi:hypothetical protein
MLSLKNTKGENKICLAVASIARDASKLSRVTSQALLSLVAWSYNQKHNQIRTLECWLGHQNN